MQNGTKLTVTWVPGHEGVEGNEIVDGKAKEAAKGASSARRLLPESLHQPLPHSKAALKQDFASSLTRESRDYLKESPRYGRIKQIDGTITSPGKYLRLVSSLPRNQASLLFQLRTGHAPLNKHLSRINRADSPKCPKCKDQEETVMHFLLKCPAYAAQRLVRDRTLGRASRNVAFLLNHGHALKPLFQYIGATERFKETFGDVTPAS